MDPNKSINVGFAAHITAAAEGGCRYDPSLTNQQRQDIENGIWLCGTCAKLIDSDEARYTVEVLRKWKRSAEEDALADIESGHSTRDRASNEDNEWASKFSEAIRYLSNVIPRFFTGNAGPVGVGRPAGSGYGLVFPDPKLRQRIETFLIHLESHTKMHARSVTAGELRLQVVRETIQEVLDRVDYVKKTDKELATRLHCDSGLFDGPVPLGEKAAPQRKPRLIYAAYQFVNATYDKEAAFWREQWSEHAPKAFVLHFANLTYDDDSKGIPALGVRASVIWQYHNGAPGPSFFPAAWIDEECGLVDIPVGFSKKLIVGIKSGSEGGYYWNGYSNPRIDANDKHNLDGQTVPYLGTMLVKLIGETGEVWFENKWEWEEDLQHGSHPRIK
jgi:hypothetical protein